MWKLKSDKGFLEFLYADPRAVGLVLLMIVGIALMLFASLGSNTADTKDYSTGDNVRELEQLCSMMDGVGECRIMMTYRDGGEEVYAVLILCEGADSVKVRESVTSLFTSLYGIGSHRVEIGKLKK